MKKYAEKSQTIVLLRVGIVMFLIGIVMVIIPIVSDRSIVVPYTIPVMGDERELSRIAFDLKENTQIFKDLDGDADKVEYCEQRGSKCRGIGFMQRGEYQLDQDKKVVDTVRIWNAGGQKMSIRKYASASSGMVTARDFMLGRYFYQEQQAGLSDVAVLQLMQEIKLSDSAKVLKDFPQVRLGVAGEAFVDLVSGLHILKSGELMSKSSEKQGAMLAQEHEGALNARAAAVLGSDHESDVVTKITSNVREYVHIIGPVAYGWQNTHVEERQFYSESKKGYSLAGVSTRMSQDGDAARTDVQTIWFDKNLSLVGRFTELRSEGLLTGVNVSVPVGATQTIVSLPVEVIGGVDDMADDLISAILSLGGRPPQKGGNYTLVSYSFDGSEVMVLKESGTGRQITCQFTKGVTKPPKCV